jgi:hypothetical protein
MDVKPTVKVSAVMNGKRYTASLAGDGVLILGGGRALATGRFVGGKLTNLKPSPPDFLIQIPLEELDVLDKLVEELRAATAGQEGQSGAGG